MVVGERGALRFEKRDIHINEQLPEPLDRLERDPFVQKVNLAEGLGIIAPAAQDRHTA